MLICRPPKTKRQTVFNWNGDFQCDSPEIVGISESTTLYVNQSIQLDCVVGKNSKL